MKIKSKRMLFGKFDGRHTKGGLAVGQMDNAAEVDHLLW